MRHIFRTARHIYTSFKLGRRIENDDPHQPQAPWVMTAKVKGQGRKVTWSVWGVLAQCCTCVGRGIPAGAYRVGRTRRPHFLLIAKILKQRFSNSRKLRLAETGSRVISIYVAILSHVWEWRQYWLTCISRSTLRLQAVTSSTHRVRGCVAMVTAGARMCVMDLCFNEIRCVARPASTVA